MNKILKTIGIGFATLGLCFMLIILIYQLPSQPIEQNVSESVETFNRESRQPLNFGKGTKLDNYTDCLVLLESMYFGDRSVTTALFGQSYRTVDAPVVSINKYFYEGNRDVGETGFRYWHGNLIPIRILLLFLNYPQIRIFNYILFTCMLIYILYLMYKKGIDFKYIIAFIASLIYVKAYIIPLSIQYLCMFYIVFIQIILILHFHNFLKENKRYIYFFLLSGMLTMYFDYLTVPILSLFIPMIFIILIDNKSMDKKMLGYAILLCLLWSIGYFGMWIAKWTITSLITGENYIARGIHRFSLRVSEDTYLGEASVKNSIYMNLKECGRTIFIIYAISFVALAVMAIFKRDAVSHKNVKLDFVFFGTIALMPIIWYCLLRNHSVIHYLFTYRSLMISVFSTHVFLLRRLPDIGKNKKE